MALWRLAPRSTIRTVATLALLLVCFVTLGAYRDRASGGVYRLTKWTHTIDIPRDHATLSLRESVGNATLGFQSILALSQGTKWRVDGLQAAAALTGLSISTPPNHGVEPDELDAFNKLGTQGLGKGSATAWMAHLNLLRFMIENGDETALILEDDVDWDVSLKDQMKRVSDGLRSLCSDDLGPHHHHGREDIHFAANSSPYGRCWDVLWVGHCGENVADDIPTWRHSASPTFRMWPDDTVVPHREYSGFAHNAIKLMPQRMRSVLGSRGTVCTFGYAVTRPAAMRLLEVAGIGDDQAFDVKLSRICKHGILRCFSVAPEVIHEYKPPEVQDGVTTSEVNAANGQGSEASDVLALGMGSTPNILTSARCAAMYEGKTCFPGRVL